MRRADISGQHFGRLAALHLVDVSRGNARWLFRCSCGTEKVLFAEKVKDGSTRSCGCLLHEHGAPPPRVIHGGAVGGTSKLYMVWSSMEQRCGNSRSASYRQYGGAGVRVCANWQTFGAFQAWALAHGYAAGLQIDRIDPSGDYCPENCRWVTPAENRSRTRRWGSVSQSTTRKQRASYPPRGPDGAFVKA